MRVAVAIMPRLLMTIVAAGRNELVQDGGQVMLQSWLELNRTDRRRAPDIENVDCPRLDYRTVNDGGHLLSEVVHVAVLFSGDRNLLLIAHDWATGSQSVNIHGHWHAGESAKLRTILADFSE